MIRASSVASALLGFVVAAQGESRPNLLIILADDLGYSDLGCYGGEIRTPNLDALASEGLRFTQTYNSSRCCPTRASLLTGLYPHQAGIGRFVGGGKQPGYQGRLTDRCVTLAEVLRPAGYATLACGKWHVNTPGPTERGFDEFYGFVHGYGVDSWDPKMMIRLPEGHPHRKYVEGEYFATDAITDHALDFLGIARESGKPWLLYVAYQAPHFPIQAPGSLTKTYVDTYAKGWDAIREQRLARMKELGLIARSMQLPPRGAIDRPDVAERIGSMTADGMNPAWESLDEDRRADLARRMAVYAAMVENMDSNIGRLVRDLGASGELDNTLILFLSDNGACAEWEPFGFDLEKADYSGNKPGHGIGSGTPNKPNVLHRGEELDLMGGMNSLLSYGCAWANACNTPLSLYKHYAHEGGIRTPMIAHWPKGIADRGKLRPQVSHVMDIMATCVDLGGASYPKHRKGADIPPPEGRSLVPAFAGKQDEPRTLIFEHEQNAAIRQGDWKLVSENGLGKSGMRPGAAWRLYDLSKDPSEQNDLAPEQPDRVEAMSAEFLRQAERTLVFPAP
ncbi:arylsulfatase [Akkermansiaceae bacterium]|nr:arylsulfatase [Akkermansiaceae bacterium]